jgi:hypothetical protein
MQAQATLDGKPVTVTVQPEDVAARFWASPLGQDLAARQKITAEGRLDAALVRFLTQTEHLSWQDPAGMRALRNTVRDAWPVTP